MTLLLSAAFRCPLNVSFSEVDDDLPSAEEPVSHESQGVSERIQFPCTELYDRYSAWFTARLVRRYGAQDAEDIGQETWLRLALYQGTREIRHPRALLLRIASNLAIDRHARRSRRERYAAELAHSETGRCEPPHQTEDLLAQQLLQSLPEALRDVFVLSRFAGLTNAQIGERLGVSTRTVDWRMTKALAHCAAYLRR